MDIYANQLLERIRPLLGTDESIVDCLPANVRLTPRCARYWDQYVRYQWYGRKAAGDVNHVIDHGYGHLVRSLPAHRTIVTFHDAAVTKVKGVARSTRLSLRYSLGGIRQAARVIADSEVSRRDFLDLVDYPEDRVTVVYPGIDESFAVMGDRDALRRRYRLPPRFVLHVGHTLGYMNVEGVFHVLERLWKRHEIDVRLVKVGDHFTGEQERLLDRLGLRERVLHLGRVGLRDLPAIYNCADVLLYPALYAGFGWPPVEAMACGTPVVCSNRGSLPEIVGQAAIVTDPDDHDDMARSVAEVLTDESVRRAYRAAGLERAQRYSWSRSAREVLAIYRRIPES